PIAVASSRRGLAPLRRKPKQLTEAPALYQQGAGPPLVVDVDLDGRGTGDLTQPAGGQGVLLTHQRASLLPVSELLEDRVADREVSAMAQRIARRLSLRRRPRDPRAERGSGRTASVPYRYRSDDIDLDRTIEVLTERPVPEDTDIIVRERMRSRRAVVVVVDVTGSMRGEKVRMGAATDAALLTPLEEPMPAARLLDLLLRVPARGLTNVHFALTVAQAELARSAARRRSAVLLTDAVHNAGPDPRLVARRFPELHVLLQTDGEHDMALGADLARLGRGRFAPVAHHRDVAPALN